MMITFLLLLFPLAMILYFMWTREKRDIIPVFCGAIAALLYCAIRLMFTYSHRVIPYSFSENFVFYLCKLSLVPVVVLYGVFFLVVKDTVEYKVKAFFPLVSSFYAIYLPYFIITYSSVIYSGYDIFMRPFVYLAMVSGVAVSINLIYNSIVNKKFLITIIALVLGITYLFIPAITDSLYAVAYNFVLLMFYSCLYCVIPFGFILYRFIYKSLKKED